jgi:hypothetical protein
MTDQRVSILEKEKSSSRRKQSSKEIDDFRRDLPPKTPRKLFDPTRDYIHNTTKSDDREDYKRNIASKTNNRRLFDPERDPVIPTSTSSVGNNSLSASLCREKQNVGTREKLGGLSTSVTEKSSPKRRSRDLVEEDVARARFNLRDRNASNASDAANNLKSKNVSKQGATSNISKSLVEEISLLESQVVESNLHLDSLLNKGNVLKDETYWQKKVDLHVR